MLVKGAPDSYKFKLRLYMKCTDCLIQIWHTYHVVVIRVANGVLLNVRSWRHFCSPGEAGPCIQPGLVRLDSMNIYACLPMVNICWNTTDHNVDNDIAILIQCHLFPRVYMHILVCTVSFYIAYWHILSNVMKKAFTSWNKIWLDLRKIE